MIHYEDFSIRIEPKRGDLYPVRVLRSPAGEGRAEFEPTFNLDELGDLLAVLGQTVRGAGLRDAARVVTPGTEPRELGHQLYNALFSGSVRSLLDSSRGMLFGKDRGLRIKLHIDPEDPGLVPLASLPWELLYRKKTRDFLSLSHSTPVVRYLDIERPYTPLALEPPLRILVVVSSPAGYQKLDLNRERDLIEQSWAHQAAVEVEFLEQATIQALQDRLAMRDVHVLHFMGHGDFDERSGQGVLLMEDSEGCGDLVGGHALGVLLRDSRTLRLVVLNACETARVTARQGLDPFAGVATALVLAGIPAVVAMQFPISDGAAITFAKRFYPLLAKGRPVDYAMTEARKAIYVAEPGTLEWATPVLFMRSPQGVIFEVSEARLPQVPPAGPPSASFESDLKPERIFDGERGQVTVQNLGDGAETFQLTWQDPAQELVFEPAQTELPVAQGQSATARFRAAPGQRRWIGGEKTHPFTAQVTSSAKGTQTHAGEVITKGLIPVWLLLVIIAALAALLAFETVILLSNGTPDPDPAAVPPTHTAYPTYTPFAVPSTYTAYPTYTPLAVPPTYTPYPTYTPFAAPPTCPPCPDYIPCSRPGPGGLQLDGEDDYIDLPDFLSKVSDFTFTAWVYWSGGDTYQRIFDFGRPCSGLECPSHYMDLRAIGYGGTPVFTITTGGVRDHKFLIAPEPLTEDTWVHVAVTLDGNRGVLYINGSEVASDDDIRLTPKHVVGANTWLGRSQYGNDPYFNGRLYDVAIFDQALDGDEVGEIYRSGWEDDDAWLLMGLHLEETPAVDGTTLVDASGHGHDGTLYRRP
jgi:hypothetical protein